MNNKGTLSGNMMYPMLIPAQYTTTQSSDVINLADYGHASIAVVLGAVAADGFTLTVEYCDDTTPTTDTAMAFNYRKTGASGTSDTIGALTACASTGLSITTADASKTIIIELNADEIPTASGSNESRLIVKMTDTATADATFGILAVLTEPRHGDNTPRTCIL